MNKIFSREAKIGASVLVALLAIVFGINYLKGVNIFKAANYYYASYTNVAGLAQSAPVTLNGYKVGLVREVSYEYDNPGHVRVEMSLDRKLRLTAGTTAEIVTDMLGTSTIQLNMGTGEGYIEMGGNLQGVEGAGLMDKVSTELMPSIMQITPHLDSLIVALTRVAADPALLSSVQRLDAIMAHLESTTAALDKSIKPIMAGAASTMANINEISSDLTAVSKALAAVSDDLRKAPLDSTLNHINAITASLDQATRQLNSTNSSLGLLLNSPELYNNLNSSSAHIDSILIDLKRQPKRYIPSIKIF